MSVADNAVGLSESQRDMARIIEQEFLAAGFNSVMAAAAIVNAMAESSLNPKASGDSGQSIGLFQLYAKGAGAGMSVAQRQDPTLNTRRIIQEVQSNYGKDLRAYAASVPGHPTEVAQATALFTEDIERPSNAAIKGAERAAMALVMFPLGVVGLTPSLLSPVPAKLTPENKRKLYVNLSVAAGALVFFGTALYVSLRRATRR